jgi:hypothetical protein
VNSSKGGKPSRGTPADRRLAVNRPKPKPARRNDGLAPGDLAGADARPR